MISNINCSATWMNVTCKQEKKNFWLSQFEDFNCSFPGKWNILSQFGAMMIAKLICSENPAYNCKGFDILQMHWYRWKNQIQAYEIICIHCSICWQFLLLWQNEDLEVSKTIQQMYVTLFLIIILHSLTNCCFHRNLIKYDLFAVSGKDIKIIKVIICKASSLAINFATKKSHL